jgi:hypothetical protein
MDGVGGCVVHEMQHAYLVMSCGTYTHVRQNDILHEWFIMEFTLSIWVVMCTH